MFICCCCTSVPFFFPCLAGVFLLHGTVRSWGQQSASESRFKQRATKMSAYESEIYNIPYSSTKYCTTTEENKFAGGGTFFFCSCVQKKKKHGDSFWRFCFCFSHTIFFKKSVFIWPQKPVGA